MINKKVELLAPAGNMVKLETAFRYGADAVYVGGDFFSLRANADNFNDEEMIKAIEYTHSLGKKIYVTMNIISRNSDLEDMAKYARRLSEIKADGVIVADLGAFYTVKEAAPNLNIHISTQANNLNWRTCNAWAEAGAVRVNLARELSISEIKDINEKIVLDGNNLELEVFVHGAMCMSFSGRCMLSDYLTNRSSNRGDCAQPCRWNYKVVEETRPNEYMPITENERGTFLFNSKDLCMIKYIPDLIDAGVCSLKIEGRMKSEFYTAVTVRAYRIAIDEYYKDPTGYQNNTVLFDELMKELCCVSHRDYSTGFYLGLKGEQVYSSSSYMRDSDYVAITQNCIHDDNGMYTVILSQRGVFEVGDTIEFIFPGKNDIVQYKVENMINEKGDNFVRASHAKMIIKISTDFVVPLGTLVRKMK